jgi:hypothetical protein
MTPGDLLETLPVPDDRASFAKPSNRWRVHAALSRVIYAAQPEIGGLPQWFSEGFYELCDAEVGLLPTKFTAK